MFHGDLYAAERTMGVRLEDVRREVEDRRLAKRLRKGRGRSGRFFCGVLVWLGQQLVTWGSRLEERYSAAATVPMSQSAKHLAS